MGGSFAAGLVRAGYSPSLITVTNPHEGRLACLKEIGINASTDNLDAVSGSDLIIVAVKPWIVPEVIRQIRPAIRKGQEVALIVAGISGADLSAMMESHGVIPPFSIVMPNTAMRLGESMTFLVPVHGECPLAGEAFGMLGKVMKIEERLLGAGTALASCGNFLLSTQGQASAVGPIVSAGYGFVCGAYMPISQFSDGLQKVLSFLPGTYGTSLLRNHAMRGVFQEMGEQGFPPEVVEAIRDSVDCNLYFFGDKVEISAMYLVLLAGIGAAVVLYVVMNVLSGKKRHRAVSV